MSSIIIIIFQNKTDETDETTAIIFEQTSTSIMLIFIHLDTKQCFMIKA